jgi:DNA-binding MarR family transcriptional regulator
MFVMKADANPKELLTVQEQRFYAFWKKNRKLSQSEMARRMGVHRQRISQLLERLRQKKYLPIGNGGQQ